MLRSKCGDQAPRIPQRKTQGLLACFRDGILLPSHSRCPGSRSSCLASWSKSWCSPIFHPRSSPCLLPKAVLVHGGCPAELLLLREEMPSPNGENVQSPIHHRNLGTFWLDMPDFALQTRGFTSFFFPSSPDIGMNLLIFLPWH